MEYEFLEHTSDALFRSHGKTYEKALENAAKAMFEVICDSEKVGKEKQVGVLVRARGLEELTVSVLGELLSGMQINELFLNAFKVTEFKKNEGKCFVKGTAFGSSASVELGRTDVKAVTYHELEVKKEKNEWVIQVLLDI